MLKLGKYRPVARSRLGPLNVYQVNDPELIREALVTKASSFKKGRGIQLAREVLGEGLLSSEGDFHKRQRRLSQPAFHKERVAAYASIMTDMADRMQADWREGMTVDISERAMKLTLEVVTRTLFSSDLGAKADEIGHSLTQVLEVLQSRLSLPRILEKLPLPINRRFSEARATLDRIVYEIIAERRHESGASGASADRGDLLSMLMAARDEEGVGLSEADRRMTDVHLRDEIMTLFLAGHETTATLLTWTWYLLSQHPGAEAKVLAEIDALEGRMPGMADLHRLPYTQMVLSEALRLYPPAWAMGKVSVEDWHAGPYLIPTGSIIVLCQYSMHRDERYYPDPEKFIPERWTPEEAAKRPKFSFFPFSGGARVCVGEAFAWMEATLVIARIGSRWRLRLKPGHAPIASPIFTLRARNGMPMVLERRKPATA